MTLLDMQNIISIDECYLDDEQQRTEFLIRYLSWDANGIPCETTEIIKLTPQAQEEILNGILKIAGILERETF